MLLVRNADWRGGGSLLATVVHHHRRLLIGAGFTRQGLLATLFDAVFAQVIWGIGYTFTSGATQAWVTDKSEKARCSGSSPGETDRPRHDDPGDHRAGALGFLDLRWPLIVSGFGYLLMAVLLMVIMPENGFTPTPREERETFVQLARALRDGLSAAPIRSVVRAFFLVRLLVGLSSETVDRLCTARVLEDFRCLPC